jgi:hypothetical protein
MEPGSRADVPAEVTEITTTTLNDLEWRVLEALKREFDRGTRPEHLGGPRQEAGVPLQTFFEIAEDFDRRKIIGRFSTFSNTSNRTATANA